MLKCFDILAILTFRCHLRLTIRNVFNNPFLPFIGEALQRSHYTLYFILESLSILKTSLLTLLCM